MLIVSGANVPFERLPHVLRTISSGIPLTHGIAAARQLATVAAPAPSTASSELDEGVSRPFG
jgi:hypothetical protein